MAQLPRIAFGGIAVADLIDLWSRETERGLGIFADKKPAPAMPKKVTKPAMPTVIKADPAPRPNAKRELPAPVAAGAEIVILRDGLDLDGFQAAIGDKITVAPDIARRVVQAGAADFTNGAAA